MASKKTTYTTKHPETGETYTAERGGKPIKWLTWIDFGSGEGFVHIGYSTQDDYAKAVKAPRGTNPYGVRYEATPAQPVEAEQPAPTAPAAPRSGEVTIPGALADHLADTNLATGADDHDPASKATREALDAGRRGRGRTLIIKPGSTDVLNVISEYADFLLTVDDATAAERRAAQKWVEQAGHARKQIAATARSAADREAADAARASADAYIAREHPHVAALLDAEPTSRATDAEGQRAATEAEGTWRGEWIGEQPTDDTLFTVERPTEQGALFDGRAAQEPTREPIVARASFRREDLDRIKAEAATDREAYRARMDERQAAEHRAHGAPVPADVQARIEARRATEQAPERRVVEGVIVTHNGRTKGTAPKHAADPDAIAAIAALGDLRLAEVTDHTDVAAEPGDVDHQPDAWGFLAEPRGHGRIALYWLESGRYVRPDGEPWAVELQIGADKLSAAGWKIEPRTRRCVMAWRPE